MNETQFFANLSVPKGPVDVVLDTDAFNEIDDQFAIAYLLKSEEKIRMKAFFAAPFTGAGTPPAVGMEKSYQEIFHILKLSGKESFGDVFRGSCEYLKDEKTPVMSDAARHLAALADEYSPEHPLYVVAIGAITNVASAFLLNPKMAENTVVVWLGGHSVETEHTAEYNMMQDIAAARVVFSSGVPLVQLPCGGVVSEFRISKPELVEYLVGKNPLADYLARHTIEAADAYAKGKPWTRVIWDVTAAAWLLNDGDRFMKSRIIPTLTPNYDHQYNRQSGGGLMRYVYYIERDRLMEDLIEKLLRA